MTPVTSGGAARRMLPLLVLAVILGLLAAPSTPAPPVSATPAVSAQHNAADIGDGEFATRFFH